MTKAVKEAIEKQISIIEKNITYNEKQIGIYRKECIQQYKLYKFFKKTNEKKERLLEELKSELAKG